MDPRYRTASAGQGQPALALGPLSVVGEKPHAQFVELMAVERTGTEGSSRFNYCSSRFD